MIKSLFIKLIIVVSMTNVYSQNKELTKKEADKIFPIIKVSDTIYKEDLNFKENEFPIYKKIAGDLVCFYAVDKGKYLSLINKNNLPSELTFEELDELAKENLINKYSKKIKTHETNFGGLGISCGGDYESSFLLINEVLDILAEELGENIIFGVPSKDIIVFINGNDPKALDGLKKMIEEIHKNGEKLLSKKLYSYQKGNIVEVK